MKIAKTATQALKILWKDGFFKTWKKCNQTTKYLAKRGNNFSAAELCTAFRRAKYLTRRGKKSNYEYIQKYPFVEDKKIIKSNKKK